MSGEEAFFPDGGDGQAAPSSSGFEAGPSDVMYGMPEADEYEGGGAPYDDMSQSHPMDSMPEPSYEPRPTDPYSLEEAAEVMEQVQSQFEASVRERADKESAQAAEVKQRAEEELDGFYDERTDEVARRQARSREQEETFLRGVSASVEESASNPWSRVCDLVDLKAPVLPKPTRRNSGNVGGGGSRRGSAAMEIGLEGEEAFRATEKMRSLIIQMKADATSGNTGDEA